MTIDKLPSGSYRIRKYYKGKQYSVTVEHKPSKNEAEELINDKIRTCGNIIQHKATITFDNAMKDYIELRRAPLSASTIYGYEKMRKLVPEWLKKMPIQSIENYHVQKAMNEYMVGKSHKTCKNMLGFITPALRLYRPKMELDIKLPQKIEKEDDYIPTEEEVKQIMEYAHGTRYEIALILASFGLRRSEICALQLSDLNGSILAINKAKVLDENRNWIIKTTKTTASARKISLPQNVVDRIQEIGMYDGCPDSINEFLSNALNYLGIQHFTLHKLRHFFATKMSEILPEADVLRLGGWEKSNSSVMKTVYRHSNYDRNKEMQEKAANAMKSLF